MEGVFAEFIQGWFLSLDFFVGTHFGRLSDRIKFYHRRATLSPFFLPNAHGP